MVEEFRKFSCLSSIYSLYQIQFGESMFYFFFVILRIFSISTIGPDYLTSAAGVVIIPIDGEYIYIVICKNIKKRQLGESKKARLKFYATSLFQWLHLCIYTLIVWVFVCLGGFFWVIWCLFFICVYPINVMKRLNSVHDLALSRRFMDIL